MNYGFNISIAQRCLAACAASYQQATITDAASDTQVLIVDQPDETIVAFRGSTTRQDWLTDFRAWRVEAPDYFEGTVHDGFNGAARNVFRDVLKHLELLEDKPLYVTGHSLGGALALLTAAMLDDAAHIPTQVITFGQPRVGDREFATEYDEALGDRTFRIVNEEDCVPRVPPVRFGYWHCGQEIFFPSNQRDYIVNPSLWRKVWSDTVGIVRDWWHCREDLIRDHALDKYTARLGGVA